MQQHQENEDYADEDLGDREQCLHP
jgi:hypothetical protein